MISSTRPLAREPDWQAIGQDYRARILSVSEICAIYGIGRRRLYDRIEYEGWPRRRASTKLSARRVSNLEAEMSQRLLRVLLMKMTELENRMMANKKPASLADCERNAKTLNTLVALFEKLKGKGGANMGAVKGQTAVNTAASAQDVERLRKDLASRLERLRAGTAANSEDAGSTG